jgi:branched-chain amino acid transport system ATP-binding protein
VTSSSRTKVGLEVAVLKEYALQLSRWILRQCRTRIAAGEGRQILGRFDLDRYVDRPVSELPEGARKLLDIAVAAALRPRLLLMDEPTAGVSTQDKLH